MLIYYDQRWTKVVTLWCQELAGQFDLDIAPHPKVLPFREEGARITDCSVCDVCRR
jgi:hypothetical protein